LKTDKITDRVFYSYMVSIERSSSYIVNHASSDREKRYAERGMKWGSRAGRAAGGLATMAVGAGAAKEGFTAYEVGGTALIGYAAWNMGELLGSAGGAAAGSALSSAVDRFEEFMGEDELNEGMLEE
jgi:hypothetical protein